MMWNYNEWWQYGMGYGFHWVFMIAFWGLVVWGAITLFRTTGRRNATQNEDSAQVILEQRYARGELNATEFEKMTKTLAKARK